MGLCDSKKPLSQGSSVPGEGFPSWKGSRSGAWAVLVALSHLMGSLCYCSPTEQLKLPALLVVVLFLCNLPQVPCARLQRLLLPLAWDLPGKRSLSSPSR